MNKVTPATERFGAALKGGMSSPSPTSNSDVAMNAGYGGDTDDEETAAGFGEEAVPISRQSSEKLLREVEDTHLQKDSAIYSLIGDLPSSKQEFHMLLRVSQRHGIPVLMSDVRELMNDGKSGAPGGVKPRRASSLLALDPQEAIRRRNITMMRVKTLGKLGTRGASPDATDIDLASIEDILKQLHTVKREDTSMTEKLRRVKVLREILTEKRGENPSLPLTDVWSHLKQSSKSSAFKAVHALNSVPIWNHNIKLLAGKHGQHVGVYFTFIKWTLLTNLFLAAMICGFFVIPYEFLYGFGGAEDAVSNGQGISHTAGDTIAGLFTGSGALNASAYFLGSYVIPFPPGHDHGSEFIPAGSTDSSYDKWNIPLAYLIVTIVNMTVLLIFIFWGFYQAVKYSYYQRSDSHGTETANIALAEFDYTLSEARAQRITRLARCQRLREKLREEQMAIDYYNHAPKWLKTRRVVLNFIALGILALSFYVIFITVDAYQNRGGLSDFVPPLVIAAINSVVPTFLKHIATLERYRAPLTAMQVTILRTCILRFVGLYVFLFAVWTQYRGFACWESYVGQRIYTQFVVGSILVELFINLTFHKFILWVHTNYGDKLFGTIMFAQEPPEFDVVDKALTLSYDQALVWVGSFFCPLLPLVGMIRAILMFYSEMYSTMRHCQPGSTVFAAKYGLKWLIWLLMLVTLALVAVPLGYILTSVPPSGPNMDGQWHDRFVDSLNGTIPCTAGLVAVDDCTICLEPQNTTVDVCWTGTRFKDSNGVVGIEVTLDELCNACPRGCGPFRGLTSPYDALIVEASTWPEWILTVLEYMDTPSFTLILTVFFLCSYLLTRAKSRGRLKWALNQERLRSTESWDKRWILDQLSKKMGNDNRSRASTATAVQ
eukprot:CAMPEP_0182931310 /NCGR_PEP_ID=MMETSP0105_2-20130417/27979_1 /TAXON_ID=81532 ORGANISM="Acanthoeca-like sp., Strain 10tr" /NCGR_SAMPLE_ID=MMETSP0105_2 /ASSEMBLY_ACC=CAM_ASM_000205 /LENGTH=887 /DNA_ID=CAMNT_0025069721 /DNA_START=22 /DNA_END=2686 /DNA_ORIENTATION=+